MIAALTDSQFNTLITAVGGLVLAVLQIVLAQRNKWATDSVEKKVETAATKHDETAKITDKILIDVNSSKSAATQQITEQQARIVQMSEKIASLEGKLAPMISPVAPLLTEAHIEQIAQRIAALSKP